MALLQDSIAPRVAAWVGGVTGLSVVVAALRWLAASVVPTLTALPLLLIGFAILVLSGLRLAAVQQRDRDARTILASLLAASRSLARQSLAQLGPADIDMAQGIAWRCIGFAHAFHDHIVSAPMGEAAMTALSPAEGRVAAGRSNPPNIILADMSREIANAYQRARLSAQALQTLEERVVELGQALSAAERFKSVPVAASYRGLLHHLVIAFGILLPFGPVADTALWTPPAVAVLAYLAFGLEAVGDSLEQLGSAGIDRAALVSVTRSVEISIRDMLGEADLPPDRDVDPV